MTTQAQRLNNISFSLLIITLSISCSCNKNPFSSGLEAKIEEQLEADVAHAVLKSDGALWTWGRNWSGQCGNGTLESSPIPQKVKKVKGVATFKFREGSAVAGDIYGNIWYWGERMIYSPPPDIDVTIETPEKISKLTGTVSIEMRASTIDLLRNDGTVWRLDWKPSAPTAFIKPEKVPGLDNIKAISGNLALKNDGTICLLDDEWIEPGWGGYIPGIQNVKALQNRWKTHTVIAFVEKNSESHVSRLMLWENNTKKELVRLTNEKEGFDFHPVAFSPYDRYLAYSKNINNEGPWVSWQSYLYVVEINTRQIYFIDKGIDAHWNPLAGL